MSIKKIILSIIFIGALGGCTKEEPINESHLKSKDEFAVKIVKNTYTCEDDEFFFIEKPIGSRIINFIYGSYSSPLSKKPSNTELYSDGVYNLQFSENDVIVKLKSEIVLKDCKKIK